MPVRVRAPKKPTKQTTIKQSKIRPTNKTQKKRKISKGIASGKKKNKHETTRKSPGNFEIKPGTGNQVRLTGNRLEPEPAWTGTGLNRNQSVSIRNITAHLINDKNTSIAETCLVFNGKSAGNNPRWIYWSYEFLFFRPLGLWTWRPAGEDPDIKIWRSKGLTPWFYVVFYGEFDGQH